MERVCLTLFLMCAYATSVYSQLEVNYSGKVGVGVTNEILEDEEEDSIMSPFSVCTAGSGSATAAFCNKSLNTLTLYVGNNHWGNKDGIGLWSDSYSKRGSGQGIVGIGTAQTYNNNIAVGVRGLSIGGVHSAGVFGGSLVEFPDDKFAGVYGSCTFGYPYFQYPGVYAGYFNGKVRVTDTLFVQSLYLPATSPCSGNMSRKESICRIDNDERVTDRLRKVSSFELQHNVARVQDRKTNSSNEFLKGREYQELSTAERLQLDSVILSTVPVEKDRLESVNYGLDAEQLKSVFPKLVQQDKEGNYSINYIEIIPLLVKSINELSEELAQLKGEDKKFVRKAKSEATGIEENVSDIDMVRMDQNKPNPFVESTVIGLNIPEKTQKANIFIYDLSGKQIQNVTVAERGETNITVYASDLGTGMYIYTLVVDGNVVVTRRMIVSE